MKYIIILMTLLTLSCQLQTGYVVIDKWTEEEEILATDIDEIICVDGAYYDITYDLIDDYDYCVLFAGSVLEYTIFLDQEEYESLIIGNRYYQYTELMDIRYKDKPIRRIK